ncbi:phosphoglycerol transferase MdoB-like AlkP superfamily enzyme [Aequitasia blattaphilus]|uniref:LTA synthase family protein n=1 Tax=Aequitasia blattaphilus TaxID=2949332 RepID=A0ABT1E664_9FIRM|nr:LTA synthase family protein [Aequitasia blattaphilus]MCP1101309.1 LTA synthase family protein [Aequitasia blattaphilus]MCR8613949.1 LTA synthase family protein [Aequitasia blattaphilus]
MFKEKIRNRFIIKENNILVSLVLISALVLVLRYAHRGFSFRESHFILPFFLLLLLAVFNCFRINYGKYDPYIQFAGSFISLLAAPGILFFTAEALPGIQVGSLPFFYVVMNYFYYLFPFLMLYLITGNTQIAVSLGTLLITIYSLANDFLLSFRGTAINTGDFKSLNTASNVMEGYNIVFEANQYRLIIVALFIIFISLRFRWQIKKKKVFALNFLLAAALFLVTNQVLLSKEFVEKHGMEPYVWSVAESATDFGTLLNFVNHIPYVRMEKPENFNKVYAQQVETEGADKASDTLSVESDLNGKQPDIIVIMNESFADFSSLGDFETSEEYLTNFREIYENSLHGYVNVPVFGGRTANSEFEYVTGFSNTFLPADAVPYQDYVDKDTQNIGSEMKELGYNTTFFHPLFPDGWNRKNVYEWFGFDNTLYLDDLEERDILRHAISDQCDYDKVIDLWKENKETGDPFFMYNVTIQNHGGYQSELIEKKIKITKPEGDFPEAEEYINCMKQSDLALKELTDFFQNQEDPVLICFFGDHFPMVEDSLFEALEAGSTDSEDVKQLKRHQTPFFIWSNYDIQPKDYGVMSLFYLPILTKNAANLELTTYNKYMASLYPLYPVISTGGVLDSNGNWISYDEASTSSELQDYEKVQYLNLFGK